MFHHLVAEDLFTVEDFNGNAIMGLNVLGELDLGEAALTQGSPQLVLPDARPRRRLLPRAHLLSRCRIKNHKQNRRWVPQEMLLA